MEGLGRIFGQQNESFMMSLVVQMFSLYDKGGVDYRMLKSNTTTPHRPAPNTYM